MGKGKIHTVLATGSIVRVIGGEHSTLDGRVISVIGGPREAREVTVSLFGLAEPVTIPQHNLKVTRSPEGWKPGMVPEYKERVIAEPIIEEGPAKSPKPKQAKQFGTKGNQSKRKSGKKGRPRPTVNGLEIPKVPGHHSGQRRSK